MIQINTFILSYGKGQTQEVSLRKFSNAFNMKHSFGIFKQRKGFDELQPKFQQIQACIESPWRPRIVYPATSCRLILVVINIHESSVGGLHHERPGGYRVDLVIVRSSGRGERAGW